MQNGETVSLSFPVPGGTLALASGLMALLNLHLCPSSLPRRWAAAMGQSLSFWVFCQLPQRVLWLHHNLCLISPGVNQWWLQAVPDIDRKARGRRQGEEGIFAILPTLDRAVYLPNDLSIHFLFIWWFIQYSLIKTWETQWVDGLLT